MQQIGGDTLPRFAVVDVETSGLSPQHHRLLQVAVVIVEDGAITDEWQSFVKLRWPWQRTGPRRVHGISRATLRDAPSQKEMLLELAPRLKETVLTAHNIEFDWSFIQRAASADHVDIAPSHRLCTLRLSRMLDRDRAMSHRLSDVCDRYDITNDRPHDALHDARATALLLPNLLSAHNIETARDLAGFYESE